jgi:hypothetical protein
MAGTRGNDDDAPLADRRATAFRRPHPNLTRY